MITAKDIPNDRLVKLADAHVYTFERRVAMGKAGARVVSVDECERYLELWRGAREKLMTGVELNATELGEIQDAIDCGDYDVLLGLGGLT